MKTLQEEWRAYRDAVYPKTISAVQNKECHQAFCSGAFVAIKLLDELSNLPEDQAVAELRKLSAEAVELCGDIAHQAKARN